MDTKWLGLWAQERQGFYAGRVIKKAEIPKYTRLILRYNKFYEKEGNKPRFVYCFADSKGYESKCVPVEHEDSLQSKIDKLKGILKDGNNVPPMMLPSESQSRAAMLEKEAIALVEEITGEKWDFQYWTFG